MKTDEAAKLRQLWQQHLKDWQQSGIRQTPWCRQRGLSPHQFSYWKKKLMTRPTQPKLIPVAGIPKPDLASQSPVVMHLPSGIKLEVFVEQVPGLVQALQCL
ncbi:MAG: hypothetical protein N0E45_21865 [Candidatus Thiodiazotropha endolucinida]|nr:hypothetical protein [Candidatus Thiodiazotropha taylori]MCG8117981.1 hypothetical protein [Candidatus Thiodiazotropha taylori]MCW4302279.1 hypothetical protein [Candidatus Thiodiazotropha endolucinida]MCW4344099.1 hypothetical protein [Candidatus Thiodiazotropha endolucinida]